MVDVDRHDDAREYPVFPEAPRLSQEEKRARAHSTFLRLVLAPYTVHFQAPSYLQPATLDLLDRRVAKETLRVTAHDVWVRTGIGTDARFWHELVLLLQAAVPSVERRSFQHADPGSVDYDSTSGALIAAHHPGLWRDLERVNDMVSIARNVLTIGTEAQDLASQYCADIEVFRLVNCCVRVTARGYDGPAGTGEEEKWQWVVNAYKKLLITCLQFLNNLVAQNEARKTKLWASLFDHTSESGFWEEDIVPAEIPAPQKPPPPISSSDILLAYGQNGPNQRISPLEFEAAQLIFKEEGFKPLPPNAVAAKKHSEPNGYVYFTARFRQTCVEDFKAAHRRAPTLAEIHRNIPHYWHAELVHNSRLWAEWQSLFEKALDLYRDDEDDYHDYLSDPTGWKERFLEGSAPPPPQRPGPTWTQDEVEDRLAHLELQMAEECKTDCPIHGYCDNPAECEKKAKADGQPVPSDLRAGDEKDDEVMLFTAEAGTKILESGKAELMKRLESYTDAEGGSAAPERRGSAARSVPSLGADGQHHSTRRRSSSYAVQGSFDDESLDEDDAEEESDDGDEEDDEDYPGSTEDGRGLLTDVPLILGPSEIEVLPMLVMSGLVLPPADDHPSRRNNYRHSDPVKGHQIETGLGEYASKSSKLRTHLLLSQTPGRNLLRELLIFVAAWDLREEELYFKFMVRILNAILESGLMPYAYHAFRDRSRSKDIISPAQAVIMKLLTCIFRQRNENIRKHLKGERLEGQYLTVAEQEKAQGHPIERPTKGSGVEEDGQLDNEMLWLKAQHTLAVDWKQALGLLASHQDLGLLNFVFTEFRQHIIPQTCALIFLQGQIHRGRASPDDFPLNLWDMERMYEGVYQFLEFFAVLSEEQGKVFCGDESLETWIGGRHIWHEEDEDMLEMPMYSWKDTLANWEMASELVTLLRELEGGIPKVGPVVPASVPPQRITATTQSVSSSIPATSTGTAAPPPPPKPQRSLSADAVTSNTGGGLQAPSTSATSSAPVAVERPFDVDNSGSSLPSIHTSLPHSLIPGSEARPVFEAETPLAFPEDPLSSLPAPGALPPHHVDSHDQDEPSDFEWRNLKKLTVLVLSSLIWKNRLVQDQVRRYGGLEALVGCCRHDENNPYIREHAIMCLRFAVEGCEENAQVLVKLAGEKEQPQHGRKSGGKTMLLEEGGVQELLDGVPREVLDANGYEAFVDGKGQTGLRRRDADGLVTANASSGTPRSAGSLPKTNDIAHDLSATSVREWVGKMPFNVDEILRSAATSTSASAGGNAAPVGLLADKGMDLIRHALMNTVAKGAPTVEEMQRAEALETLDRAFESTEAALGNPKLAELMKGEEEVEEDEEDER